MAFATKGPKGFVSCRFCSKKVSKHSLGFHEEQCEKRSMAQRIVAVRIKKKTFSEVHTFVQCYICNQKVSQRSSQFHEPVCLRKWHAANNALPKSQRQPEPLKTQLWMTMEHERDLKKHQGRLGSKFFGKPLPVVKHPLPKLTKTKTPTKFDVSRPMDGPGTQIVLNPNPDIVHPVISSSSSKTKMKGTNVGSKIPSTRMLKYLSSYCYVCFKKFTRAGLALHEPRCLEHWKSVNDGLPESERRPAPVRPAVGTLVRIPNHYSKKASTATATPAATDSPEASSDGGGGGGNDSVSSLCKKVEECKVSSKGSESSTETMALDDSLITL